MQREMLGKMETLGFYCLYCGLHHSSQYKINLLHSKVVLDLLSHGFVH